MNPSGYSVLDFGSMIANEPRMGAYAKALRQAITPGCTVFDIGAGFGVFSLLACQFGAGRVFAIEPDPSIELLPALAKANGCADRITVVRDVSTRFDPPMRADVIVSDCRGSSPLFEHHIPTIADARARLLAPGGVLVPMRDTLRIALASSPKAYRFRREPWQRNRYGLDLSLGQRYAANEIDKAYLGPRALASAPQELAVLDYRTITDPNLDASAELTATSSRQVHGLLMWFDAEIAPGIGYSNAPGEPKLVYGQTFLPLIAAPHLAAGDRIAVRVRASLANGKYVWVWSGETIDGVTGAARDPFSQSSFFAKVHSPGALALHSHRHVPAPSMAMAIDRDCLAMAQDGAGHSLDSIARMVLSQYPARFQTHRQALNHVVALFERYQQG